MTFRPGSPPKHMVVRSARECSKTRRAPWHEATQTVGLKSTRRQVTAHIVTAHIGAPGWTRWQRSVQIRVRFSWRARCALGASWSAWGSSRIPRDMSFRGPRDVVARRRRSFGADFKRDVVLELLSGETSR